MPQADPKNSSGQEQQKTAQTVPYPSSYPQQFEEDTINLYELWIILWKSKWLVIGVTVVAALGSVVYALNAPRVYKAEALLLPPKEKDVQSMNVQKQIQNNINISLNEISVEDVFRMFKQNLKSRTLHKKFIKDKGLMRLLSQEQTAGTRDEEIYQEFAELIKIKGKDFGITSLSIELNDAEIAAQWVNDLTKFVDKETIVMLMENVQYSIANQIREIKYKIESKRQLSKQRREDRIIQYEEAAFIAQKLGLMDRVDSTNIVQNNQLNITTSNIPLYFRGYWALTTEVSFLKNRESDDSFIAGLRDLQEQLALLRSIKFDKEKMSAVYIDQEAYPPKIPIKPNRRLIVSLTTVVGLFSGTLLAFFINFVQNQRKKLSE